ncbi:MAG: S8 family serine peptidase [Phycisphaerales bacterium]|nr:MAG: S8 family serine peptidase [Phycisphaerales bacterium]
MIRFRRDCSFVYLAVRPACLLLFIGFLAAPALAQDGSYVMSSGRAWPMVKSDSEFAVYFKPGMNVQKRSQSMANEGIGVMQPLFRGGRKGVRLFKVADTSVERRNRALVGDAIEAIRPVYRFEGIDSPMLSTGTIVLKFAEGVTEGERAAFLDEYGMDPEDVVSAEGLSGVYRVRPSDGEANEVRLAEELNDDDRVAWAQPNLIRPIKTRQAAGILDEYFNSQWHLEVIQAVEAWSISEGQDVVLGMFDDACDVDHRDLRNNFIGTGHDPSLPSNDPGFDDPRPKSIGDRHGTAVMGIAVASGNQVGVRGVAYLANFTCSRAVFEDLSDFEVAGVFTFARQEGVDVHINSWGTDGPNSTVIEEAIRTAFQEGRGGRGMVVVFATGNDAVQLGRDDDYSSLPEVIGVGASNQNDVLASYSNFGDYMNVLAPSNDVGLDAITTTDNEDDAGYAEDGYNRGGFVYDDLLGLTTLSDIDSDGDYTRTFGGTSAACPIAAGVAALILSVNPGLTATDVRLIMEHTADQIDPEQADYDGVTHRSVMYGYGRVNALKAVEAALDSLTNGGLTWPEAPSNVQVVGDTLRWEQEVGTGEFLVLESDQLIDFMPEDAACYSRGQVGCSLVEPAPLPAGLRLIFDDCVTGTERCEAGSPHVLRFEESADTKYFAFYGRSNIGRYSFGVRADTSDADPGGGPTEIPPTISVSIDATPKSGTSPLTVRFVGNAVSTLAINKSETAWDFDISDAETVNTRERTGTYTYQVLPGDRRTFTAELYMEDIEGNSDTARINIFVDGGGGTTGPVGDNDIEILVGVAGTAGSDVDTGTAPFAVELTIDAESLVGTFQSVFWDLGDGTTATSLVVPHTYQNDTDAVIVYPVTVTVTTLAPNGQTVRTTASRLITVFPAVDNDNFGDVVIPGEGANGGSGGGIACGALGSIMPLFGLVSLMLMRRRMV